MVIRMDVDNSNNSPNVIPENNAENFNNSNKDKSRDILRRTMKNTISGHNNSNTKAEFRRLETILPSIKRKENVSNLDIILEAIKYIDDLQDQLVNRLGKTVEVDSSTTNVDLIQFTRRQRTETNKNFCESSKSSRNSGNHSLCSDDENSSGEEEEEEEDDENESSSLL